MPKLPRDVSHDRLVRFLCHRGWTIARERGRHTVLKTGMLAAIRAQASVTREEAADL